MMESITYLEDYGIVVCKQCMHAIWPSQVKAHFQSPNHRWDIQRVRGLMAAMDEASLDLIQYSMEFEVPNYVDSAVPELKICTDGLMCQLKPKNCQYICRINKNMRTHCQRKHGWKQQTQRGRPSKSRQIRQQRSDAPEPWKTVVCQRFFVQGHGSQYVEVRGESGVAGVDERDQTSAWGLARKEMDKAINTIKEKEQRVIQEGGVNEVNPWLERAGWHTYLMGLDREELVASVDNPNSETEPIAAVIWDAMDSLIQHCQQSVVSRVGVFVRMEAIRTEKHQTRYQPLQPYMNAKGLGNYSRSWKQVLMFIVRTKRAHDWVSPKYKFKKTQRRMWKRLLAVAKEVMKENEKKDVESEEEGEPSENSSSSESTEVTGIPSQDSQDPELSMIQKACLNFCSSLLNDHITRKEYDSPLVCALAVLGVKVNGWMDASNYPPILSAMIKVSRFMVIQQGLEMSRQDFGRSKPDSEDSQSSSSSQEVDEFIGQGCLKCVVKMMDRFMVRGSHGPMQWMLDLRTYGLKIHYNTTSEGHIDWVGDQILYKSIQFSMGEFRGMIHGLVVETRRMLMKDLIFEDDGFKPPGVPWQLLRDNPIENTPGWNFIQDARNRFEVDGKWWLYNRIGQNENVKRKFIKPGQGLTWNRVGIEGYMHQVMEYREKLLMLIHVTGGQPARAPELLSIRHSNTIKGEHRNVFVEDGLIVFMTRYHKGYTISGNVKVIHRYLPREVGELVMYYLWLVLPFQQRLEAAVWKKDEVSAYMWPSDPDGKKWTSERMRKVMKRESHVGLGLELTIQSYRELAIGISRKYMRGGQAFRMDEDDEDGDWQEGEGDEIMDLQAGHTAHVAGMIYARGIMERSGEIASKRQKFRECSEMWHRFLGFESTVNMKNSQERKRKMTWFESEAEEARMQRWKRSRSIKIEDELKRVMGVNSQFRGMQKSVIEAVMKGISPIVVIMATGGGKSLLFMLPAWCSRGGTSIVVVPLIALRQDMKQRCEDMGITCAEWNSRRPPDTVNVVLVTPESAVSDGFRTFINRLRATQVLDRIIIDECHIVLNEQQNFRRQMQQLGDLVAAEVQMMLLTATLPPSKEKELWRRMSLEETKVTLFRAKTVRKNVRYRVMKVRGDSREEEEARIVRMVEEKLTEFRNGKMVVYCNSVRKVKGLAEALNCDGYHHHAEQKDEKLRRSMDGEERVIIATSALGLGIDIPDIRVIIHADEPRSLLDYAQESGRAGRDGLPSQAIVMWRGESREEGLTEGWRMKEVEWVKRFIGRVRENTKSWCQRVILDEYLDGRVDRTKCEEGEEMCDGCSEYDGINNDQIMENDPVQSELMIGRNDSNEENLRLREHEENAELSMMERQEYGNQQHERLGVRMRRNDQRREEGEEAEALLRHLEEMKGLCAVCTQNGRESKVHPIFYCRESDESVGEYHEMKKLIREWKVMGDFGGCRWCFVPQAKHKTKWFCMQNQSEQLFIGSRRPEQSLA
jgi:RecQ family ATP-dependent DNA helicase